MVSRINCKEEKFIPKAGPRNLQGLQGRGTRVL